MKAHKIEYKNTNIYVKYYLHYLYIILHYFTASMYSIRLIPLCVVWILWKKLSTTSKTWSFSVLLFNLPTLNFICKFASSHLYLKIKDIFYGINVLNKSKFQALLRTKSQFLYVKWHWSFQFSTTTICWFKSIISSIILSTINEVNWWWLLCTICENRNNLCKYY